VAETVLGIDIGGSGIKGNMVNLETGVVNGERFRIPTPNPSTPALVAEVVKEIVEHFGSEGPVGCTFPAIVRNGITLSAANVDPSWIGADADKIFTEACGLPVTMINDADAAGVAEMAFGAGKGNDGLVMLLTFGTGIGSAVFYQGLLIPNTEFGHLELKGHAPVESWAAARFKEEKDLSWETWAKRVDRLLDHLERIVPPDLFIIGGGVSRKWDQWGKYLSTTVATVPAALRNEAGIVGAALTASAKAPQT